MKSDIYILLLIFLLNSQSSIGKPIIMRHDVNDIKFVLLAEKYGETKSLFFFNETDMAGVLVDRNWVLTAAHVAVDLNIGDSISTKENKYPIRHIYIHPEWENDQAFDLALIKIEMGNNNMQKIPIYKGRDELNEIVIIAGNGDKGTGLSGPTGNDNQLRAATNRVDEVSDYWLKWDFNNPDKDSNTVTELEGISGPGDSGGPAFIFIDGKGYLAGISSAQSTKATNGQEGLYGVREYYVRLSSYVEWISLILVQN